MSIKVRRPRLLESCQCHQLDSVQWILIEIVLLLNGSVPKLGALGNEI